MLKVLVGLNVDRTVYGLIEQGSDEREIDLNEDYGTKNKRNCP